MSTRYEHVSLGALIDREGPIMMVVPGGPSPHNPSLRFRREGYELHLWDAQEGQWHTVLMAPEQARVLAQLMGSYVLGAQVDYSSGR